MSLFKQPNLITKQNQLKVLTLNCWGIPIIAKDLDERINAISNALAGQEYDVVALQEVYYEEHQLTLAEGAAKGGLIYNRYFRSGLFGSGLMILSKYPMRDAYFKPYILNGRPQDLIRSDYYAGKGYACVTLDTPNGLLKVINTHWIAAYLEIGADVFFSHRVAQAVELAYGIKDIPDTPVLLLGDFNTIPEKLPYRIVKDLADMSDSFTKANPNGKGITVTTDIPYLLKHEPERIDYILWRNGKNYGLDVLNSEVVYKNIPEDWKGKIKAFSDHYGVTSTFEWKIDEIQKETPLNTSKSILVDEIQDILSISSKEEQTDQPINGMKSILWGVAAFAAVMSRKKNIRRRDFLGKIFGMLAIAFMVVFGLQISMVFQSFYEVKAYQDIIGKLHAIQQSKYE